METEGQESFGRRTGQVRPGRGTVFASSWRPGNGFRHSQRRGAGPGNSRTARGGHQRRGRRPRPAHLPPPGPDRRQPRRAPRHARVGPGAPLRIAHYRRARTSRPLPQRQHPRHHRLQRQNHDHHSRGRDPHRRRPAYPGGGQHRSPRHLPRRRKHRSTPGRSSKCPASSSKAPSSSIPASRSSSTSPPTTSTATARSRTTPSPRNASSPRRTRTTSLSSTPTTPVPPLLPRVRSRRSTGFRSSTLCLAAPGSTPATFSSATKRTPPSKP